MATEIKKCLNCGGIYRGGVACPHMDQIRGKVCGFPKYETIVGMTDPQEVEKLKVGYLQQILSEKEVNALDKNFKPSGPIKKAGNFVFSSVLFVVFAIIALILLFVVFGIATRVHNAACGYQTSLSENC